MAATALAFAGPAGAAITNVNCPSDDLQSAINAANPGDTLVISGTCYGNFKIDTNPSSLTLRGANSLATLDGQGNDSVLKIEGDVNVSVQNLRIVNGRDDDDGAGIDITDCGTTVNLVSLTIVGNVVFDSGDGGGGVYVDCSTVSITNSLIAGNSAHNDGGGVWAGDDADVTITGTTIRNNSADDGGGVNVSDSFLSLTASSVINNVADGRDGDGRGGGIRSSDSNVLLTSTKVSTNKVTSDNDGFLNRGGGGIYFDGNHAIAEAPITGAAPTRGDGAGALVVVPTGLTLVNSSVDHNVALRGDGGGIRSVSFDRDSNVTLDRSIVSFNSSGDANGGGIANEGVCENTASVLATGSTFQGNQARFSSGGAVFNLSESVANECDAGTALVTIAKSPASTGKSVTNQNQAANGGGYANIELGGVASLMLQPGASVTGNKASGSGGGVYNYCGSFSSLGQIMLNAPNNVTSTCPF